MACRLGGFAGCRDNAPTSYTLSIAAWIAITKANGISKSPLTEISGLLVSMGVSAFQDFWSVYRGTGVYSEYSTHRKRVQSFRRMLMCHDF